ncbi:STAS domain-containing protein [Streptomyces sp. NPDC091377]|uniref:STAS domain-containing protein n=1 Tax=Streptomyces sp. NPDC091377 TaxID=3365995 RepID=UPI003830C9B0
MCRHAARRGGGGAGGIRAASGRAEVDLARLKFCDGTGLSALMAASRRAEEHGTELRLRAVPHTLARLLRVASEVTERAGHTHTPCLVLAVGTPGQPGKDRVAQFVLDPDDDRLVAPPDRLVVQQAAELVGNRRQQRRLWRSDEPGERSGVPPPP